MKLGDLPFPIDAEFPVRNLYELFRDGLLDDAVSEQAIDASIPYGGRVTVSMWALIPVTGESMGRMQTAALVRRFLTHMQRDFAGGVVASAGGFCLEPHFVDFIRTHRKMGSTHKQMVMAWDAMSGVQS